MNGYPRQDPLTLRVARSLHETRRDPHAWWEGPRPIQKPRRYRHSLLTRLAHWVRDQFT